MNKIRTEENVVVLGATNKPERYSNIAMSMLTKNGHHIFPVHPSLDEINEIKVFSKLEDIKERVDTITIYLSPKKSAHLIQDIVNLKPGRVILNPGTESPTLESALKQNNIPFEYACTLVLLQTGQF